MDTESGRRVRYLAPAAGLLVVAGAAQVWSFFLRWARVTYPTSEPGVAVDAVGHHRIALLLGIFTIVAGLVSLAIGSREARLAWASVGGAAGVIVGGFAVFDLLSERDRAVDQLVERSPDGGAIRGLVLFSFRPGIYLALAGAVIAVGALVSLFLGTLIAKMAAESSRASRSD
jgi:hypothetical protein